MKKAVELVRDHIRALCLYQAAAMPSPEFDRDDMPAAEHVFRRADDRVWNCLFSGPMDCFQAPDDPFEAGVGGKTI